MNIAHIEANKSVMILTYKIVYVSQLSSQPTLNKNKLKERKFSLNLVNRYCIQL